MAIKDFIGHNIGSGLLFDGTYGIEVEAESMVPYNSPRCTFWSVKEDGSLRDFGREFVLKSPVHYGTVYEALQEFEIKTKGIKFNQDSVSTSIHVHTNILPETWKTLGNFLTIYTLVENLLIEYSGEFRRNNLFCLPIRSVPYVNKLCVDIFKNVQKKNFDFRRSLDINQIKYAALNLGCLYKFGSVELRSHKGVTDIDLIFQWVTIINDILEFSRQDYTPDQILDTYKLRGNSFLRDIFGNEYRLIKHDNITQLLKDNLWYASNIGYVLSSDQWKGIDEKPKEIEVQYSTQRLNAWSYKLFGIGYNELNPEYARQVIERIKLEDAKKKAHEIAFGVPVPSSIDWNEVVLQNTQPNPMFTLPVIPWEEEDEYIPDFNEEPE